MNYKQLRDSLKTIISQKNMKFKQREFDSLVFELFNNYNFLGFSQNYFVSMLKEDNKLDRRTYDSLWRCLKNSNILIVKNSSIIDNKLYVMK